MNFENTNTPQQLLSNYVYGNGVKKTNVRATRILNIPINKIRIGTKPRYEPTSADYLFSTVAMTKTT